MENFTVITADRYLESEFWWIISELIRRNPELKLTRASVPDGDSDWALVNTQNPELEVRFNLLAGIYTLHDDGPELDVAHLLETVSNHHAIRTLEDFFG
ncbi:MAG: hypothetical protein WBA28_00785, partial [Microbacteriaceae bacterium]